MRGVAAGAALVTRPRIPRLSPEQAEALLVEGEVLLPLMVSLLPVASETLIGMGFPAPAVATAVILGQDRRLIARRRVRGRWVATESSEAS